MMNIKVTKDTDNGTSAKKQKRIRLSGKERCRLYEKVGDVYEYFSYRFHRTGLITTPKGNPIKVNADNTGSPNIVMILKNGKRKRANAARIIYEMYSGHPLTSREVVLFKDGDPSNIAYSNLYISERKGAKGSSEKSRRFSEEEARKIREHYHSFPRRKNQFDAHPGHMSQRRLAEIYHCSIYTIEKVVSGRYIAN